MFHYLPLLTKRPGAFDHAKPLKMWKRPVVFDSYLARLRERLSHRMATMEFLRVMELCVDHSLDEVAAAVDQAMTLGSLGASTVAFLLRSNRTALQPAPSGIMTSAPATSPGPSGTTSTWWVSAISWRHPTIPRLTGSWSAISGL